VSRQLKLVRKLARRRPLHPLMIVIGLLLVAGTAKLGHAMWGVGGIVSFYPAYVGILLASRQLTGFLSQLSFPQPILPQLAVCRAGAPR
jgi:hypothetical protein